MCLPVRNTCSKGEKTCTLRSGVFAQPLCMQRQWKWLHDCANLGNGVSPVTKSDSHRGDHETHEVRLGGHVRFDRVYGTRNGSADSIVYDASGTFSGTETFLTGMV